MTTAVSLIAGLFYVVILVRWTESYKAYKDRTGAYRERTQIMIEIKRVMDNPQ